MTNPTYLDEPKPRPAADFGKKRAVLLVNLGTPDGTDYWSMRRYLKEFLSDQRVIEVPRVLWWLILNLIILTVRPSRSGAAYASIWDKERNASPLRVLTEAQTADLAARLAKDGVEVRYAMRYGQPAIRDVLDGLMKDGFGRITILPLYPQYSAATVATVVDEVAKWLMKQRWQPSISVIPPYYDEPAYIGALAASIRAQIKAQKWVPEVVMASFHGMPLEYCKKGDVYYCHSHKTARLLAEKLGMVFCRTLDDVKSAGKKPKLLLTFQSRFGKAEWLQPYTDITLENLAHEGITNVLVTCPGFAADCVETLEEVALEGRDEFLHACAKPTAANFGLVPCLNASTEGMEMLEALVRRWVAR